MPSRRHRKSINAPGHAHELTFSCYQRREFLRSERTCGWLAESIDAARESLRFDVWAYVFMPNHAHLILDPNNEEYDIGAILKRIKQPVSRKALAWLEQEAPDRLRELTVERGGRVERRFWQRGGGYDRNVTEPQTLERMIDYLHLNPVRKSLIERASDWKWSSAGWFEGRTPNDLRPDPIPPEWTIGNGITA